MTQVVEEQIQPQRQRQFLTIALAAWGALVLFHIIGSLAYPPPHHDQRWYLYAAKRFLSGATIYGPQISETNPPLIIWFSTLPVLLAHLLHLDALLVFRLLIIAMICGSVAWSLRIVRTAGLANSCLSLYIGLSSFIGAETWLSGLDMGQREHLFVILMLPYILSAGFALSVKLPVAELCAIGVAAGLAICFKPQQVLAIICLEIFIAVWTRSFRRLKSPTLVCATLTILSYIALVRFVTPLYFRSMIPILRETYWAYGPYSAISLVRSKPLFNFFFVLVLVLFLMWRRKLRFAVASGTFLICSFASYAAFCAQHTGWAYQEYPQEAFLLLTIFYLIIGRLPAAILAEWKFDSAFRVASLIFVMALSPLLIISLRSTAANQAYPERVFAQYPPQTPAYIFSPKVSDGFPAIARNHLVWASRFPNLWMLPAIVQNEKAELGGPVPQKILPPAVVKKLAAMQRTDTAEDFQRWRPEVVIVKQCRTSTYCYGLEKFNFNPLTWFLQSRQFAAEWSNYRFQTSSGDYDVYLRIH